MLCIAHNRPKKSWEIDVCQHKTPLSVKRINDTKIEVEGVMEFRRFHCGESSVPLCGMRHRRYNKRRAERLAGVCTAAPSL